MKEFMKRIDVIVILVLVASIGLNIYFLNQKPKQVIQTITNTQIVEKPVTVTKIVTKYETKLVTESVLVSVLASDDVKAKAYEQLVNSELLINTTPLTIIEDKEGKLYIPESLTGNAKLAFLEWEINVELNPKTIWQKKTLPIDMGFGLADLKPEIGVCVDIPFTELDTMVGFKGANVCLKQDLTKNSKLRYGLGMDWDKQIFTFIGLRTNIF
ncbi:MAG: hypothetical protein PHN69_08180 [Candidatus Pacebacteria bacterium]|nr:hypothetical protein [Candidatus Paceibacterota bacterium]